MYAGALTSHPTYLLAIQHIFLSFSLALLFVKDMLHTLLRGDSAPPHGYFLCVLIVF